LGGEREFAALQKEMPENMEPLIINWWWWDGFRPSRLKELGHDMVRVEDFRG
jgi:hypothetical protein